MIKIEIDISIQNEQWPNVQDLIQNTIHIALKKTSISADEISIVLADNDFIQNLNKTYRNKDKPTNVLSFPQDTQKNLGDIVLALETIQSECLSQDKSFEHHLQHLVVHGFLHLLGHDHEIEEEAQKMESLEIEILNDLGIKNPYETE